MANNEMFISPKIDPVEERKFEDELSDAVGRASEDGAAQMKHNLNRGMRDGVTSGMNFMSAKIGAGAVAAGNMLADAVSEALGKTWDVTFGNLETVREATQRRMEQAGTIAQRAEAIGAKPEEYAMLQAGFARMGVAGDEFNDLVRDFRAVLKDEEFAQFKNIADKQGVLAAFLSFLRTVGTTESPQARQAMAQLVGEDVAPIIEKVGLSLADLGTETKTVMDVAKEMLKGLNYSIEDIRKGILRTNQEYLEVQQGEAQRLLNEFATGVKSDAGELENSLRNQMQRLENAYLNTAEARYKAEMEKIALETTAVNGLSDATQMVVDTLTKLTTPGETESNIEKAWDEHGFFSSEFWSALGDWATTSRITGESILPKTKTKAFQPLDTPSGKFTPYVTIYQLNSDILNGGLTTGSKK
ncbi:hypothetical protein P7245_22360 [Vibrio parahaemolyticus]|nr:hypothetical protein [Vibrio parahaemolyticus]